ncbi:MAG: PIN domain-containing protein [Trueperaceae bacterium]|nr:PIN domain-containing protein [Trueperaceae bacterium]
MPHLIDSNLLIYPFDARDPLKQTKARQVLSLLDQHKTGLLSSQALLEFANVMLRKLKLPSNQVYSLVDSYERIFPVLPLTSAVVLEAVRGVRDHHFGYYDAQVWSVAKLNQLSSVLSEDFATGSSVEGISFLNPLEPNFALGVLER